MNFGLNKVTGTGRQTVEQLKHKVIDGGGGGGGGDTWEEVSKDDIVKYYDEDYPNLPWYEIPQTEKRFHIEADHGSDLSDFSVYDGSTPTLDGDRIATIAGELETVALSAVVCDIKVYPNYKIITVIGYANDINDGSMDFRKKFEWCLPNDHKVFVSWYFDDDPPSNEYIKFYKKV